MKLTAAKSSHIRGLPAGLAIDSFVMLSMSLVSLALGTALHLQLGMSFLIAVIAALSAYLCLLALHAVVRRTGNGGIGASGHVSEPETEKLSEQPTPSLEPQIGEETLSGSAAADNADVSKDGTADAVGGAISGIAADRLELAFGKPREQAAVDMDTALSNVGEESDAPFEPVLPAWPDPDQADADALAEAAKTPAEPIVEKPAVGEAKDAAREVLAAQPGKSDLAFSAPETAAPSPVPVAETEPAPPVASANVADGASPVGVGPSGADVEMIGGMIKELADRVNAAEPQAAKPNPGAAPTLTESLAAASAAKEPAPVATAPPTKSAQPESANPAAPVARKTEAPETVAPVSQEPALPEGRMAPAGVTPPPLPPRAETADDPSVDALRQAAGEMREFEPEAPAAASATAGPPPVSPAHARLAAIADALASDRVEVVVDRIVSLGDQSTGHFELSLRLKDAKGNSVSVVGNQSELAGSGILALHDTECVVRSAQAARHLKAAGETGSLLARFSREGLAAEQFLDTFAEACRVDPRFSEQLVLSFSQADVRAMGDLEWATLNDMKDLGFRFALTDVSERDMDFAVLKEAGFGYMFVDAATFTGGLRSANSVTEPEELRQELETTGIALLVCDIRDEAMLSRVVDLGVGYGQGTVFGAAHVLSMAPARAPGATAAA